MTTIKQAIPFTAKALFLLLVALTSLSSGPASASEQNPSCVDPGHEPDYQDRDKQLWHFIQISIDRNDFRAFLILYPKSKAAAAARDRLTFLIIDQVDEKTAIRANEAARVWQLISSSDNPNVFRRYMTAYPTGKKSNDARLKLQQLCAPK